jgi:hypothetical protein
MAGDPALNNVNADGVPPIGGMPVVVDARAGLQHLAAGRGARHRSAAVGTMTAPPPMPNSPNNYDWLGSLIEQHRFVIAAPGFYRLHGSETLRLFQQPARAR